MRLLLKTMNNDLFKPKTVPTITTTYKEKPRVVVTPGSRKIVKLKPLPKHSTK